MKKILLATAIFGAASLLNADILVGFSFNGMSNGGNSSFAVGDISDITGDTDAADTGGFQGTSNGSLYYGGTNGSSNFNMTGGFPPGTAGYEAFNLPQNNILSDRVGAPNLNQYTTPSSLLFYNTPFGDASGSTFVIEINGLSEGVYSDIVLSYAAANQTGTGSSTILWEVSYTSFDSGFSSISEDTVTSTIADGGTGQAFSHNVSGSGSSVWIRGTVDNIVLGNPLMLDNILISGNVVPEPSTYAAIAGGLALAFVALRRRLRK
ncbi:PEP-CTERM sorting domain-containing protein [Ruficoccus amylovorans]|uniref:PEP-CTERM sorting domain-containing protein n=1 Tax=Ruficoccus amylovorans TaxID=1804625 RepID=A0A842HE50_9BACT|nr:PEP-CTERM sorting domain-containing protein [Ruficoccus amylovorans]MBC2594845.1 PEP-CTERM sorting domain-containing protein [Ruficoccus amylovorans]